MEFASNAVTGVAYKEGSLYAILGTDHPTGPDATNRSLWKSTDDGPDLLGWEQEPEPAMTPFLENRNVQFIRGVRTVSSSPAWKEGALLRSDYAGASYAHVLYYEGDAPKYPYVTHILFPSRNPSMIVIAGFDKANGGPFLAISPDDGVTWIDQANLLPGVGLSHWFVGALTETRDGRMLIEVRVTDAQRRRAVRR